MKTIFKSSIFDKNEKVHTHAYNFKTNSFKEEIQTINCENGKGYFKEFKLDGIRITIRDFKTKYHEISVSRDFPYLKLHFEVSGSSLYTPFNKLEQSVFVPGGHYNLFYLPVVNGLLTYNTNYRKSVEIVFTEAYIKKILGKNFKNELYKLGSALEKNEAYLMWDKSMPITSEISSTLQEIVNCDYCGTIKKAFIETKVNELLIVLLAKTNEEKIKPNDKISENEYAKMKLVQDYINQNLNKNLTIPQLSLFAGMNTTKLKHDFKIAFSSTVFKYITKVRMERAKELISKNNLTIAEIANMVGYKHAQHFTVAFKKVYGNLPSKIV